jgi:serine/threonine protein kinase
MISPVQTDPAIGQVLADAYRLERCIGSGGMGKVYEATHLRSNRRVAVKVLLPAAAENPTAYARFRREAQIATELGDPHIVEILAFDVTPDGQPYLVMELLEGVDLMTRLQDAGHVPVRELVDVLDQVASALQAAHAKQIIHRDLKPENIFLVQGPEGLRVKLLDFGLSKIKDGGKLSALTLDNSVFGTPSYMSPEQAEGLIDEIDHTTDIFALGVIAYHCLTGVLPFDGPSVPAILYNICHVEPQPACDVVPDLPLAADAVLRRALAKRKVDRYQEAVAFVADLRQALSGQPVALAGSDRTPRVERLRPSGDVGQTLPPEGQEQLLEISRTRELDVGRTRERTLDVPPPRQPRVRNRLVFGAVLVMLLALGALVAQFVINWDDPGLTVDRVDRGAAVAAPRTDLRASPARRPDMGAPDVGVAEVPAVQKQAPVEKTKGPGRKVKKGKRGKRGKLPVKRLPSGKQPGDLYDHP